MAEGVVHIDSGNWQSEVVESTTTVLVDFWAEWCAPCLAIAPVLEELVQDLGGKLKVAKVDVDKNPELAGQFGIRSIPTLLIFKDGVVQQQMVGAMNKSALKEKVEPFV